MIKGVFFDIGGTLYSYRNVRPATMLVLEKLAEKLEHDATEVANHFQLASKEVDKQFADIPFYLFRDYFKAGFANFLGRIGKPHLQEHFDWFEALQRDKLVASMELQSDCQETLEQLKSMGLYLSAVSNIDENMLTPLVERGQLDKWLVHITSSEAAQSCKPDRRFFEVALAKSGLSPDQVLFVGDALEQDILGAHSVGMHTALISEVDQPAPMHIGREVPEPNYRINRLSELPGIIRSLA